MNEGFKCMAQSAGLSRCGWPKCGCSTVNIGDTLAGLVKPQVEAIKAIVRERIFQDIKYGDLDNGGGHTLGEWAVILEFELREFKTALIKGGTGRDTARQELVQIAAVALAALEQHGIEEPEVTGRMK